MFDISIHKKIHFILVGLLLVILPFSQAQSIRFTGIALILITINYLLSGRFKEKFRLLKSEISWLLIASHYLLCLIGLCYTSDFGEAGYMLIARISIIILPLIFFSGFSIQRSKVLYLFLVYSGSLLLSILVMFYGNYAVLIELWDANLLEREEYFFISRVYLGMFICIALTIIYMKLFQKASIWLRIAGVIVILFLAYIIYFAEAKMAMLTIVVLFTLAPFTLISKRKYALAYLATLCLGLVSVSYQFNEKLSTYSASLFDPDEKVGKYGMIEHDWRRSMDDRSIIWNTAISELSYPVWLIGVGTGDVKKTMYDAYSKMENPFWREINYNPHNQFLSEWLRFGLIGIVMLLIGLLLPLYWSIKTKDWLYAGILIVFILHFQTESYFAREAGILTYSLFQSILLSSRIKKK